MRYLLFLLFLPSFALADVCENLELYAFSLVGCPQQKLGVDTKIPLCDQEQWKYLSWMDSRCYREEIPWNPECVAWDCLAPYDRAFKEPISGKVKVYFGSRELVDWNYRAARASYGAANAEIRKLKKKRK